MMIIDSDLRLVNSCTAGDDLRRSGLMAGWGVAGDVLGHRS